MRMRRYVAYFFGSALFAARRLHGGRAPADDATSDRRGRASTERDRGSCAAARGPRSHRY